MLVELDDVIKFILKKWENIEEGGDFYLLTLDLQEHFEEEKEDNKEKTWCMLCVNGRIEETEGVITAWECNEYKNDGNCPGFVRSSRILEREGEK